MIETRKPVSLRWSEFHHEMLSCIQSKPNASPSEVAVLDVFPVLIDLLLQKQHRTIRVVISEGDGLSTLIAHSHDDGLACSIRGRIHGHSDGTM